MSVISSASSTPVAEATGKPGFWQRREVGPVRALLLQGITPRRMAATLATGTLCSLFPFLGFTSLLNLGVGLWLRMNQPILQTLNQLLGPVQLLMILVYVRMGELIWGAERFSFSVGEMTETFRQESLVGFLEKFGWAGIHAFTAWAVTGPVVLGVVYFAVNPLMRRWSASAKTEESER